MIAELLLEPPLLVHHVGTKLDPRLGHALLTAVPPALVALAQVTPTDLLDRGAVSHHQSLREISKVVPRLSGNKLVSIKRNHQKTCLSDNCIHCDGSNELG